MKKWLAVLIIAVMITTLLPFAYAAPKLNLMVYTSMKETLIGEIRDAFVKKYPNIQLDYYSAGAGKLMAKIAAERQSGKLATDVLWTSEIPDFYQLKRQGMLQKYVSPQAKYVVSPVIDPDSEFIPARLGTLGITYNTNKISKAPKTWQELLDKSYFDGFGIADPSLSGTAMVSVAMLQKTFGWEFFEKLKANQAKMGQGSGQVVDDTASGDLKACIGVDYITIDKIKKGATLGFTYPKEMLVVPSPVAIFKKTPNLKAAKIFVDFLLSKPGQTIIANNYTLPVRRDVPIAKGVGLVEPDEAVKRAISIDYLKMINEKESIIQKFTVIMRSK
jgi:iron(III) transport system substrate-binding protein